MAPTTRLHSQQDLITKIEKTFPIIGKNGITKTVWKTNRPKIASKLNKKTKYKRVYNMTSQIRGFCLIFANVHFEHHQSLNGYNSDAYHLENVFKDLLFQVKVYRDSSVEKIKKKIQKYSRLRTNNNSQDPDAFVVVILTHGRQNGPGGSGTQLIGTNAGPYPTKAECVEVEELTDLVNNKNCKLLQNKPKLFFIQACRGEKEDSGVSYSQNGIGPFHDSQEYLSDESQNSQNSQEHDNVTAVAAGNSKSNGNIVALEDMDTDNITNETGKLATITDIMLSDQIKNLDVPNLENKKMKQPIEERYIHFTGFLFFNPKYHENAIKIPKTRKRAFEELSEPTLCTTTKAKQNVNEDRELSEVPMSNTRRKRMATPKKVERTSRAKTQSNSPLPPDKNKKDIRYYFKPRTNPPSTGHTDLSPSSNGSVANSVSPNQGSISGNSNSAEESNRLKNIKRFRKDPPKKMKKN